MESSAAGTGPAEAAGAGRYEFTSAQNVVIGKTAKWSKFWGWVVILTGVLYGAAALFTLGESIVAAILTLAIAAFYVFIGMYFKTAGSSLQSVVETSGNDISHLMTALDKLGSVFKITGILMLIGIVLGVAVVLLAGGATMLGGGM